MGVMEREQIVALVDSIGIEKIERVARALNDDWAAGSQGGLWWGLDECERIRWREAAVVAIHAAEDG